MPSMTARLVSFILRKTGTFRKNFTGGPLLKDRIAKARRAKPIEPNAKMRAKLSVSKLGFQHRTVWQIGSKAHSEPLRLLYFHGGGYIYGPAQPHFDFLTHMADVHGIASVAPLYPLAPEAGMLQTTSFALDFYRAMLGEHHARDIVIAGDSAGAGLVATTIMAAREEGLPLPAKVILICPWLEASPTHPDQALIEPRDAILTLQGIEDAAKLYAREAGLADPRVSPLRGDWKGLPQMLVYGGGSDILVTDARALKEKLPSIDYVEEAGMIHDWPIFFFPESRKAQARMAEFIKG